MNLNTQGLPTPCYVVDQSLVVKNLEVLAGVMERTGCRILLAQKGFSMFALYPLIGQYLSGTTASSLFEARLGHEEMGKEVHIYAPAYREEEFAEICRISDHIVFNSFAQWRRYKDQVQKNTRKISCGLRVNLEYSEIETALYDPCAPMSRLGIPLDQFEPEALEGIEGIHFHTMCEQNADVLDRTLKVFEEKFGPHLHQMKWVNFGGGHHVTRKDYDVELLIANILRIKERYQVQVYLEPGEAIALNTGYLVSQVLDLVHNGMDLAIMDTSAACHMPDVLEMPYRPEIIGGAKPGEKPHVYRLGGPTCLAGDVIGDYAFDRPLEVGDHLVFCDMAHYTMVKNNTFNGINLPSIVLWDGQVETRVLRRFGYEDFKTRLS